MTPIVQNYAKQCGNKTSVTGGFAKAMPKKSRGRKILTLSHISIFLAEPFNFQADA
jgi:hypothetical protein